MTFAAHVTNIIVVTFAPLLRGFRARLFAG